MGRQSQMKNHQSQKNTDVRASNDGYLASQVGHMRPAKFLVDAAGGCLVEAAPGGESEEATASPDCHPHHFR